MTNFLSPAHLSLYDVFSIAVKPMSSLVADVSKISVNQADIIAQQSVQATVVAILAYCQQYGHEALLTKVFQRSQLMTLYQKPLNLSLMPIARELGQTYGDLLFATADIKKHVYSKLSDTAKADVSCVKPALHIVMTLCLREVAMLCQLTKLDAHDVNKWMALQPQLLTANHFRVQDQLPDAIKHNEDLAFSKQCFDTEWFNIIGYVSDHTLSHPQQTDTHIKETFQSNIKYQHSNEQVISFTPLFDLNLPNQRWLIQLAKVSQNLSAQHRFQIASRVLSELNLNHTELVEQKNTKKTVSEVPFDYVDSEVPFWKNPTILVIFAVISGLSILAGLKYYHKQSVAQLPKLSDIETPKTTSPSQDVAIIRTDE